ncbi:MAG: LysM peptidoglycan-binding domain-containing protein [Elusimicrobiales bacterium]|nr:LysM peptidoglycan-binding domain-containing protein [Elusimicrobiales bacterium]
MKKISLLTLALIVPALLCAQEAKPVDPEFPEEYVGSVKAAAPAKAEKAAESKVAATLEPVAAKAPAKPKAVKKTEVKVPAAPAAAKAKAAAAAVVSSSSVKAAAKPVEAKAPAKAKAAKTAAVKKAPAPKPAAPVGPGNPAKPGDRLVLPKQDPASQVVSKEFAAVSGIPREALESGGFVVGKMYSVVRGDTLWDLSGKYYNNPFLWGKIYNANFKTVANPDRINPAQELIIPDINDIVIPYRRAEAAESETLAAAEDSEFGEISSSSGRRPAPAQVSRAELAAPGEILKDFDQAFFSEEMPEDQKEWSDGLKIVPDSWSEDGEITAKLKGSTDSMDESFSLSGEEIEISMSGSGMVKPGDYLAIYLKGGDAYSKSGQRLGRELQPAGLAEVVSVRGSEVKARVIDAVTAIAKGYIVKKK